MADVEKQPTKVDKQSIAAEKTFKPRRPNFDFLTLGIPIGSVLQTVKDPAFFVTVAGSKRVKIGNEEMSLTEATRRALKLAHGYPIQPAPYWKFNGQLLEDLYEKVYGASDE